MVFQKLILISNPVTEAPATALIEVASRYDAVAITTLDGEYHTIEEFDDALNETIRDKTVDKIYNFFPMTLPDIHALVEALTEVLLEVYEGCA